MEQTIELGGQSDFEDNRTECAYRTGGLRFLDERLGSGVGGEAASGTG